MLDLVLGRWRTAVGTQWSAELAAVEVFLAQLPLGATMTRSSFGPIRAWL